MRAWTPWTLTCSSRSRWDRGTSTRWTRRAGGSGWTACCSPRRVTLDYGFITGTLAEDGEPLDALVWLEEPTFPGCLVTVRPVAVFWMLDEGKPDAKVLTVVSHDLRMEGIQDLEDVPAFMTAEIGHFFDIYKELEPHKSTDVRGWMDRAEAERVIEEARLAREARASLVPSGAVPAPR